MKLSYLKQADQMITDWDNMFFQNAVLWSRKSHDVQTQCGCVLVKNKTIIATGFNGFIRSIDDLVLPNTRPEKYPFMIHAEANAVYNAAREGQSTMGARAYITAPPCVSCLQMLWQTGIHEIYFSDLSSPRSCFYGDKYELVLDQIIDRIKFVYVPKSKLSNYSLTQAAEKF